MTWRNGSTKLIINQRLCFSLIVKYLKCQSLFYIQRKQKIQLSISAAKFNFVNVKRLLSGCEVRQKMYEVNEQ